MLFVRPGFDGSILEEGLAKKCCIDFNVYGRYCEPEKGCKKRHVLFFHFKPNKKTSQNELVRKNENYIAFNANEARNLPDSLKSLAMTPGRGEN